MQEFNSKLDDYLDRISHRGKPDGTGGGLLDLLTWCGKLGLRDVTEDDARRFWEDPDCDYRESRGE